MSLTHRFFLIPNAVSVLPRVGVNEQLPLGCVRQSLLSLLAARVCTVCPAPWLLRVVSQTQNSVFRHEERDLNRKKESTLIFLHLAAVAVELNLNIWSSKNISPMIVS
jgi:hypothetical protein